MFRVFFVANLSYFIVCNIYWYVTTVTSLEQEPEEITASKTTTTAFASPWTRLADDGPHNKTIIKIFNIPLRTPTGHVSRGISCNRRRTKTPVDLLSFIAMPGHVPDIIHHWWLYSIVSRAHYGSYVQASNKTSK